MSQDRRFFAGGKTYRRGVSRGYCLSVREGGFIHRYSKRRWRGVYVELSSKAGALSAFSRFFPAIL